MRQCRICLDDGGLLISPCRCSGTSKYVHYDCLENWRQTTENEEARKKCMECNAAYLIRNKYKKENIFIDRNKSLFFKNFLFHYLLLMPIMYAILAIDYSIEKKSLKFLEYVYPTNITQVIEESTLNFLLYYNIFGYSVFYFVFFIFFGVTMPIFVYQKCRYLKIMPMWFLTFLFSNGYIYLYLLFYFNEHYYLYFGMLIPFINYILCTLLIDSHNDMLTYLNKKNKNMYLEYRNTNNFDIEENNYEQNVSEESEDGEPRIIEGEGYYFNNPTFQGSQLRRRQTVWDNEYSDENPLMETTYLNENNTAYPPIPANLLESEIQTGLHTNVIIPQPPPIPPPPEFTGAVFSPSSKSKNENYSNKNFTNFLEELTIRSNNNTINLKKVKRTKINLKRCSKEEINFNNVMREFTTKAKQQKQQQN